MTLKGWSYCQIKNVSHSAGKITFSCLPEQAQRSEESRYVLKRNRVIIIQRIIKLPMPTKHLFIACTWKELQCGKIMSRYCRRIRLESKGKIVGHARYARSEQQRRNILQRVTLSLTKGVDLKGETFFKHVMLSLDLLGTGSSSARRALFIASFEGFRQINIIRSPKGWHYYRRNTLCFNKPWKGDIVVK